MNPQQELLLSLWVWEAFLLPRPEPQVRALHPTGEKTGKSCRVQAFQVQHLQPIAM